MKIYKTYFSKDDTPFSQEFQKNKKYHTVWKRHAYKRFFGHNVVKVKKFGLFNVKNVNESPQSIIDNLIKKIDSLEMKNNDKGE